MEKLSERHRDRVIDELNGRLAFERSGVKLYDAIVAKMEASDDPEIANMLGAMLEHRDQEKEHEEWLEEQIRRLGGDAHTETGMSTLIETESKGIEQVVFDGDPNIAHLFHALLAAELVDNAGWALLLDLADEADDVQAREEFKRRLHEEENHLIFVRRAVTAFARNDVLGAYAPLPMSP